VLVVALLAATATAFAVTENLKLEPTPISKTRVDDLFSPVCDCATSRAVVAFKLRKPDVLTLSIVSAAGTRVRELALRDHVPKGEVSFIWDGRDDEGRLLPDGLYHPRAQLDRAQRTFDFPNPIRIDTTAPVARLVSVRPATFSPDGDGRSDKVSVRYTSSEPAIALVYVNDVRRLRGRGSLPAGKLEWYGKVHGRSVRPGPYRITVVARDLAGNISAPSRTVTVRVRYVELGRHLIRVRAGTRFGVRVDTDARTVGWRLGKRHGHAPARPFVLRAPTSVGRFTLTVRVGDHVDRARILVRPRRRGR
jgi:hypothetical protein